jgi:hypothetical protein
VIIPSRPRGLAAAVAVAAAFLGTIAAIHYAHRGLSLSHYDARGHLIVARRIFDSLTPGWQQIGAVWLPVPHLLNAVPVQIDAWYRTGASGVALSVAAYALAAASIAAVVLRLTQSRAAALAAVVVFALNPNVLYLQATPMTEPLLIGLTLFAIERLIAWVEQDSRSRCVTRRHAGIVFALACLTRYEAWPVASAALLLAAWVLRTRGDSWRRAVGAASAIGIYPVAAIAGFLVFSRVVGGQWFAAGFFVPENTALGRPGEAFRQIVWGVRTLSGPLLLAVSAAGLVVAAVVSTLERRRALAVFPLALIGAAAVPWVAFVQGHPYRIRYMVPLLAAEAVGAGVLAGLAPRRKALAATAIVALAAVELRPLASDAPMVVEAQWDRPNIAARQMVTDCLRPAYRRGEAVMASMGSLGHYMQELASAGFDVRDFLHEGNGDIWLAAVAEARPFAGWVLIEEQAEGGDMLAQIAREDPRFLKGFSRVCEGAGLALYRRNDAKSRVMTLRIAP